MPLSNLLSGSFHFVLFSSIECQCAYSFLVSVNTILLIFFIFFPYLLPWKIHVLNLSMVKISYLSIFLLYLSEEVIVAVIYAQKIALACASVVSSYELKVYR